MKFILLPLFFVYVFSQQSGYDPNWFVPDIVTTKHDPFDLISSNFGQPAGEYNWLADQYGLMGRAQKRCNGCTRGGKDVAIVNNTIFINDVEYFILAMCYTPVPLGIKSVQQNKEGGGFCSTRQAPTGEPISACNRGSDTDYFHGSDSPGRIPEGPKQWFSAIWERDFPVIRSSGANTVRMYYTSPITRLYTDNVLAGTVQPIDDGAQIVAPSNGYNHIPYMDTAYRHGLMVIYPLIGDQTLVYTGKQEVVQRYIENQIDEVGNHPALLMYTVGNEWNIMDPVLMAKVNQYMKYAREYSIKKWDRSIPVTHVLMDNPHVYDQLYEQLDVDIFSTNAGYRGMGFSDLWDGTQTADFSGLGPLSDKYKKPNFVSEIGWMQLDGQQTAQPQHQGWFNIKWRDLIQKGTPAGNVGGAFFEYLNEILTKGDPEQQTHGIVASRVSSLQDFPATTGTPNLPSLTYAYTMFTSLPSGSQGQQNGTTAPPSGNSQGNSVGNTDTSQDTSVDTSLGTTREQTSQSAGTSSQQQISLGNREQFTYWVVLICVLFLAFA